MDTGFYTSTRCCYIRTKRKNLRWYKKVWNIITGHKDRNWEWIPVGVGEIKR